MKLIYRITVCFLLLCIYANAQVLPVISEKSLSPSLKYSIQSWTTENGLPQNTINDISQTKDGYLWLATFDGLVRFDGLKFKTFNTGNTPELKTNAIKKLFTDNEDRLWIINAEGDLSCYFKNKFTSYPLPAKLIITSNVIVDYENESVLVLCSNNKFYLIKNNKTSETYFGSFKKINAIQTLNANQLYIATDEGLYSYINDELSEFPALKNKRVVQLYRSPFPEIIANSENKLYALHANNCKPLEAPTDLSKAGDYNIGFNDAKLLTVLSENNGISIAGKINETISMEAGLSSNNIRSIFVDREKNLWIGTNNGGLNKLKRKLFKAYSKEDGMLDDAVTAITGSKSGSVYIGNNCGGFSEFYKGSFVQKLKQPKNKCVWSLMEDPDQNLWLGIYGGGIYVYEKNGQVRNYTTENGLSGNIIFSIYCDSKKTVWIGTSTGLSTYSNGTFRKIDLSFQHSVTYIHEDKNGELWLCTDVGLATIKNNKIILQGIDKGFKAITTRYIYEDAEGILWIGTHGSGLARVKNGKVYYFTDHTAQLDKNVWSIAEDKNGNFWMPSNAGMYVVDKKELNDLADNNGNSLNPVFLSKEDGLKSIEFNGGFQPSVYKNSNGEFWFPTVKGAVVVDPASLQISSFRPQIVIEQLLLDEKPAAAGERINLRPGTNSLAVTFSAPSFNNPSRLCFEYKMEGSDNSWTSIGNAHEIRIGKVPSGIHTLRIRITGSSSAQETSMVIDKPIVFWKQTKFIFIASLIFVFIFLLLTVMIISFVRKRERIKTQINKQYANIELKALQAQMNPHFIFNCLNSIQHFIIVNDEISASKYLTKFSMMMRKFLEHSKSNIVTLQEEIELLRLYVELEALRSKNKFSFQLKMSPDLDIFNIEIPSMLFQPFIENAITHGLLNQEKKGTLLLSFEIIDSHVIGIIEDNGVGRKKAIEINTNAYKDHASRGMEIINERIAVLNYIENIKIEVEIIDKTDEQNEPAGTRVIIKIPI